MSKTVGDIVKEYLQNNGYSGLCGDDCVCELDDLFLCGEIDFDCVAGYKSECPTCANISHCEKFYDETSKHDLPIEHLITTKRCWVGTESEVTK